MPVGCGEGGVPSLSRDCAPVRLIASACGQCAFHPVTAGLLSTGCLLASEVFARPARSMCFPAVRRPVACRPSSLSRARASPGDRRSVPWVKRQRTKRVTRLTQLDWPPGSVPGTRRASGAELGDSEVEFGTPPVPCPDSQGFGSLGLWDIGDIGESVKTAN